MGNYRTTWKLRFRLTCPAAGKSWAVDAVEELAKSPNIIAAVSGDNAVDVAVLINDSLDVARESAKELIHVGLGPFDSDRLGFQFLSSSDTNFQPT
jgi:hypothetical protein